MRPGALAHPAESLLGVDGKMLARPGAASRQRRPSGAGEGNKLDFGKLSKLNESPKFGREGGGGGRRENRVGFQQLAPAGAREAMKSLFLFLFDRSGRQMNPPRRYRSRRRRELFPLWQKKTGGWPANLNFAQRLGRSSCSRLGRRESFLATSEGYHSIRSDTIVTCTVL